MSTSDAANRFEVTKEGMSSLLRSPLIKNLQKELSVSGFSTPSRVLPQIPSDHRVNVPVATDATINILEGRVKELEEISKRQFELNKILVGHLDTLSKKVNINTESIFTVEKDLDTLNQYNRRENIEICGIHQFHMNLIHSTQFSSKCLPQTPLICHQ